jgi:diguanylate cyclase (GGDEF)-like protein
LGKTAQFWRYVDRLRLSLLLVIAGAAFLLLVWMLRISSYTADPMLDTYLQMAGSLIAFTFAANALVRFRGTHDRISLILAFGFVLAGLIEAGTSMTEYRNFNELLSVRHVSLAWMADRTLLGILLVAGLVVERQKPVARDPAREIGAATLIVGIVAYLTSVFYFAFPVTLRSRPDAAFSRPWDLLPAVIFLIASIGYWHRLGGAHEYLDRALFIAALLNVACHLAASQSQRLLDAPLILAHVLMVSSYAVVLGGTLLDNAHLFDQVSRLAVSDPLTGLANHRRMIDEIESELQRSGRTGRHFAVLLLDLDGLKKINDKYGHLVGSQAIKRVGEVLRRTCRSVDTAARYGGDEFAVVLPEASQTEAVQAAARICELLEQDEQEPRLSISVGVSVYPTDGTTTEKLLNAADKTLYQMKGGRGRKKFRVGNIAACL